jgi:HD-GYP domain-containing protein (c-di-GMP phosphodiesterase class II)
MEKYILLGDQNEDNLQLQITTIKYFYSGKVLTAKNAEGVKQVLKDHGHPELALIDFELLRENHNSLYQELHSRELVFPVVATSTFQADDYIADFPLLTSWLVKPLSMESLTQLVKSLVHISLSSSPSHVSVDIRAAVKLKTNQFDFYLRLSGKNYVKIINQGQTFTAEDGKKLLDKGITDVHIPASQSFEFLKLWQQSLEQIKRDEVTIESSVFTLENLEQLESISKALNWSPEVVLRAKDTVKKAIIQLSKNENIFEVLNEKMKKKSSNYASHVSLLSFLTCVLCEKLEGTSDVKTGEAMRLKMAMASLLHDYAVDETHYENIEEWNKRASNMSDRTPATIQYRLHPFEAAKIAQSMDTIPPDVDRIVMQHHEKKDGSGFPRGLTGSQISYLSAFFIIVEDMVGFLNKGINTTSALRDFLTWADMYYDEGNFKKVFESIRLKLVLGN